MNLPSAKIVGSDSEYVIDWRTLRQVAEDAAIRRSIPYVKNSTNRDQILHHTGPNTSPYGGRNGGWYGYSTEELQTWITKGFDTDKLGLELTPPVREKRRYIYSEEAEELHIDRALSGEDNYAGEFTKRKILPGMKIRMTAGVSASTDHQILNAYNVFVCQCISSLEASGIDCEVTCEYNAVRVTPGVNVSRNKILVKKENEATDLSAFSGVISPAVYRTFFFMVCSLHSESLGRSVVTGMGNSSSVRDEERTNRFDVVKVSDSEILFTLPWFPHDFPRSDMERAFKLALDL